MNRRHALHALTGIAATAAFGGATRAAADESTKKTGMGLVAYCLAHHQRAMKRRDPSTNLFDPATFLAHCHRLGAGGVQVPLGVRDAEYTRELRRQAEDYGMYLEGIVSPPKNEADVERFDAHLRTAAQAGAAAVRTVIIPGRRYEFFDSLEKFREFEARGRRALELAAPVAERHRMRVGVENHKDHRVDQRVELLKHIGSEYVGACVDTGNNMALLEDPVEVARKLAPFAVTVHLKDQAVGACADGFLLADIPLGQGCIDLKTIVDLLREAKPQIHFGLELITRDPLRVPCLTDKYWATFPDLPALDLARTLNTVRRQSAEQLQDVGSLSPDEQVALELANVKASLRYARDSLGI